MAAPGFFLFRCRAIKITARKTWVSRTFDLESTDTEAYRHVSLLLRVEISRPGSEARMMEALSLWPLATIHERCQIIPLNRESFGHEAPKHCHTNREEHAASLDHGNTTHCTAT